MLSSARQQLHGNGQAMPPERIQEDGRLRNVGDGCRMLWRQEKTAVVGRYWPDFGNFKFSTGLPLSGKGRLDIDITDVSKLFTKGDNLMSAIVGVLFLWKQREAIIKLFLPDNYLQNYEVSALRF